MEDTQKQLLQEQISKIEEVLSLLEQNFAAETEKEISFMKTTSKNLKELTV